MSQIPITIPSTTILLHRRFRCCNDPLHHPHPSSFIKLNEERCGPLEHGISHEDNEPRLKWTMLESLIALGGTSKTLISDGEIEILFVFFFRTV
ncbi:hypothetical protein HanIR_Chr09g0428551 [Helianthus annuus]|nr:hypothetical protein HanIR_Chr09g0428551 [Helianthus annuus]